MSEIDIRKHTENEVTVIEFADPVSSCATHLLKRNADLDRPFTMIGCPNWAKSFNAAIYSEEDAVNLIKALQYAIENKWFHKTSN